MYTLIKQRGLPSFIAHEAPALLCSWLIAEMFYKFGSFTLETGAFLITWYVTGFLYHKITRK
ncbi:MAG TPA: hypothetical protein VFE32_11120 [Puia sp.]|jgi:hypothetical protein|nr:hypothetical protein [Puia sp.]